MLFNKSLIILFSTVALLSGVFGITSEEKRLRRQRAEAADKQLKFAPVHDIPTLVSQKGLTLLFFGAHWCKYTQLFTPKFLAGVNQLDRLGYNEKNMPWLAIRKVECGEQELEKECVETYKTEGYPTIWLYSDGQPIEEYPDADETGPFVEYMKRVADYYAETHKSSVVGEPHQPLQQLGPQQPPQTVKAVVSEEHIKAEDTATIASTASSSFSLSFGLLVIVALFVIYGLVKMSSRNSPNGPRYNKIAA